MLKQIVLINNKLGLHARASAKFVSTAGHFSSHIDVKRDSKVVNGKSIMGIMMLAAAKGTELELIIEGADETAAMQALVDLIANKFGEGE